MLRNIPAWWDLRLTNTERVVQDFQILLRGFSPLITGLGSLVLELSTEKFSDTFPSRQGVAIDVEAKHFLQNYLLRQDHPIWESSRIQGVGISHSSSPDLSPKKTHNKTAIRSSSRITNIKQAIGQQSRKPGSLRWTPLFPNITGLKNLVISGAPTACSPWWTLSPGRVPEFKKAARWHEHLGIRVLKYPFRDYGSTTCPASRGPHCWRRILGSEPSGYPTGDSRNRADDGVERGCVDLRTSGLFFLEIRMMWENPSSSSVTNAGVRARR